MNHDEEAATLIDSIDALLRTRVAAAVAAEREACAQIADRFRHANQAGEAIARLIRARKGG